MFKKIGLLLVCLFWASAVLAQTTEKKETRLGLKGGVIYPSTGSDTVAKTDTMSLLFELDIKRSSRLDTGFRFGYDAFATRATNYYACYNFFQLGYGTRYYFDERQSPENEFYTLKKYVMLDIFAVLGNKTKDLDSTVTSPQNLYGLEAKAGAGLEYVFGPLSSGFVDVEYLIMNAKTGNGAVEFPLNGLVVAFGIRLAR